MIITQPLACGTGARLNLILPEAGYDYTRYGPDLLEVQQVRLYLKCAAAAGNLSGMQGKM